MADVFVHESSYVDDGCEVGEGTKIWHFSHVMSGSRIGKHHKTGWIIAGACVFLGFAAALLSDGPEALAQFERMQAYGMASAAN